MSKNTIQKKVQNRDLRRVQTWIFGSQSGSNFKCLKAQTSFFQSRRTRTGTGSNSRKHISPNEKIYTNVLAQISNRKMMLKIFQSKWGPDKKHLECVKQNWVRQLKLQICKWFYNSNFKSIKNQKVFFQSKWTGRGTGSNSSKKL